MIPAYYRPHKPHNCRRAKFHNYKAPGTYMITISKSPECLDFSQIDNAGIVFSKVGKIIDTQIRGIEKWRFFKVRNYVVMPDHLHILWEVTQWLEYNLGHYVGLFKARCAKDLREANISSSVFGFNFNDKIGFDDALISRFDNYISDNPRRRWIAINHPELFERMQCVEINDREMDLYGNFQLLKHPIITPAIVSSRYTAREKAEWERAWDETIRAQGVLVSPFISEAEQALMMRAITEGASIIRIVPDGIPPKYKPYGKEFDLCAEGRCLHIGPPRPSKRKHVITRGECLELNEIARWIASHPADMITIVNALRR